MNHSLVGVPYAHGRQVDPPVAFAWLDGLIFHGTSVGVGVDGAKGVGTVGVILQVDTNMPDALGVELAEYGRHSWVGRSGQIDGETHETG